MYMLLLNSGDDMYIQYCKIVARFSQTQRLACATNESGLLRSAFKHKDGDNRDTVHWQIDTYWRLHRTLYLSRKIEKYNPLDNEPSIVRAHTHTHKHKENKTSCIRQNLVETNIERYCFSIDDYYDLE